MVLIKLPIFPMSNISLSLQTLSTLQIKYLIHCSTYIKFNQQLYLVNLESFFKKTTIISLNFGIVLAVANSHFTIWSIKKLRNMTSSQPFLTNTHRALVGRVNVKTFSTTEKCIFKYQITKGIIS